MDGIDQKEVYMCGEKVNIGEQFDFIDPDFIEDNTSADSTRYMIKIKGKGPFTLLGVKYYPRDGHPLFMVTFNDSSDKTQEMTSDYFCKVKN